MEVTSKTGAPSTVCLREGKKEEKQQEGLDENILRQNNTQTLTNSQQKAQEL